MKGFLAMRRIRPPRTSIRRDISWTSLIAGLAFDTLLVLAAQGQAAQASSLDASLAEAARHTRLADIDFDGATCKRERTVERWLRDLTGRPAAAIRWTGGPCRLRRTENARDSGGQWCGQAMIGLARVQDAKDRPLVEIYFERPRGRRPGKAYAFRGEVRLPDGLEYTRFPTEFEAAWLQRFPTRAPRGSQSLCSPR